MLFNSIEFVFFFLPIVLLAYYLCSAYIKKNEARYLLLVVCSLFFYGWWNYKYLAIIIISISFNYTLGTFLSRSSEGTRKKLILAAGISANLVLLGYFKYTDFLLNTIAQITDSAYIFQNIVLPLAISFFTFQQIAYLVDSYKAETREYNFIHYTLFVTFFPQLIAGPIVHHKEMMPQFQKRLQPGDMLKNIYLGAYFFSLGLFKKIVIADGISSFANNAFNAADSGATLYFMDAWGGALAYTFQLYFDFSGYADMAIGSALMFGIALPLNFNSPYKSVNITEFWRRWHMTLSRFLRDYIYIPLGGNRNGTSRKHTNLMITMLLGGLWHGAGWNFIIWGGLHGFYLVINHFWQTLTGSTVSAFPKPLLMVYRFFAWLLTFLSVVVAWVFFRALTMDGAIAMLKGMFGLNGHLTPYNLYPHMLDLGLDPLNTISSPYLYILNFGHQNGFISLTICLLLASITINSQQIVAKAQSSTNVLYAFYAAFLFSISVLFINQGSQFLYFQF